MAACEQPAHTPASTPSLGNALASMRWCSASSTEFSLPAATACAAAPEITLHQQPADQLKGVHQPAGAGARRAARTPRCQQQPPSAAPGSVPPPPARGTGAPGAQPLHAPPVRCSVHGLCQELCIARQRGLEAPCRLCRLLRHFLAEPARKVQLSVCCMQHTDRECAFVKADSGQEDRKSRTGTSEAAVPGSPDSLRLMKLFHVVSGESAFVSTHPAPLAFAGVPA